MILNGILIQVRICILEIVHIVWQIKDYTSLDRTNRKHCHDKYPLFVYTFKSSASFIIG